VDVPDPSPLQAENTDPAGVGAELLAVALSVTTVLSVKLALQVPVAAPFATEQLMPSGELAIVPAPAPAPETVSTRFVLVMRMVLLARVVGLLLHPLEAWQTLTVHVPPWSGV
jgi:hypothetical protein